MNTDTEATGASVAAPTPAKGHFQKSLVRELALLVAAALVLAAIGLSLVWTHLSQEAFEQQVFLQQDAVALAIAREVDGELQERLTALQVAAGRMDAALLRDGRRLEQFLKENDYLLSHFGGRLFVTDEKGYALAAVGAESSRVGVFYGDRDVVRRALGQKEATVGEPVLGKKSPVPFVLLGAPIFCGGTVPCGTLAGAIDLSQENFLRRIFENHIGSSTGFVLVSRISRQIVTATNKALVMKPVGNDPQIQRFISGEEGHGRLVNQLGVPMLATVRSLDTVDWYVAVNISQTDASTPLHGLNHRAVVLTGAIWFLALAFVLLLVHAKLKPLRDASAAYARQSRGTEPLRPLPVHRHDEVGALIHGFNLLLDTARGREEELQKERALLERLFDALDVGVVVQEPDSSITVCNRRAWELLGLSEDQLRGKTSFDPGWNIVNENGQPLDGSQHPSNVAQRTGQAVHNVVLGVWVPKTASRVWLLVNSQPRRDVQGGLCGTITTFSDITHQKQIEVQLAQSEGRYRAIIDSTPVPMALNNERGDITYLNPAFTETFGYFRGDIPTLQEWWPLAYPDPDYRAQVSQEWQAEADRVQREGGGFLPREVRIRCKDGATRVVQVSARTFGGALGGEHLVVLYDITAQKQAQEHLQRALADREALLREVHHRVKNNLQVVASLLRLEHGRNSDAQTRGVLQEMQGRIRSMALLHETLYRTGQFAEVELGGYLRQLATQSLRSSSRGEAIELDLDVAAVAIGMDQATPCALVVNELLSNCVKHAFPQGHRGRVSLRLSAPDAAGQVLLQVCDNGVGLPPDWQERRQGTLGLQLVDDLARQLGGNLEVSSQEGTEVKIRFSPRLRKIGPLDAS